MQFARVIASTTDADFSILLSLAGHARGKYAGHAVRVYKRRSEVPEWLRFNPYVLDYYRSNLTVSECVASVFAIHNETGGSPHLLSFQKPSIDSLPATKHTQHAIFVRA